MDSRTDGQAQQAAPECARLGSDCRPRESSSARRPPRPARHRPRRIEHPVLPESADHALDVVARLAKADILDPLIVVARILRVPLLNRMLTGIVGRNRAE